LPIARREAAEVPAVIEGLDPSVWAGLRVLPAAAHIELIDTYFEYSLTVLTDLQAATDAGNGAAFWLLVHQLKGCSASLGVLVLWRLCEEPCVLVFNETYHG
jgi:hypothetical protein